MQAVILAAGKGLRLRPFTEHHPKPLIPIADKPLIEYTIEVLPDCITEIVIVVGYLGNQIKEHIKDSWNGLPVQYVEQENLVGTGDALLTAKPILKGKFLVVNGDDLYGKPDLTKLAATTNGILAWNSSVAYEYGLKTTSENLLCGFDSSSTLLNCGAYVLNRNFFDIPLAEITVHDKTEYSLPHTLVNFAEANSVSVVIAEKWLPVGTPTQLHFANNYYLKKHLS